LKRSLTIGLDIAKDVFHVQGVDRSDAAILQRKLRRADVMTFFSKLKPDCVVSRLVMVLASDP
jgi:transposase